MAYPVMKETRLFKEGVTSPWVISLLKAPAGKYFISLRPSSVDSEVVILELSEKEEYQKVVEIMKSAVSPVVVKER